MSPRQRNRGIKRAAAPAGAGVAPLTWAERLDVIDALCLVLDGVYSHLPLKRSLYGFDVIRGLEHLRQQVPIVTDLQFHRELTLLINRLRDAHTQYTGPWTVEEPVASLPFLVEAFGPTTQSQYVVSKVDRRSVHDPHFTPGVALDHWNGVPFDRAVELHAESQTGGRPDARRARALESLTFRALDYGPPPNEEWVVIGYRDKQGKSREVKLYWEGINPARAATASRTLGTRVRTGINRAAEEVRRAKKMRFNPALWAAERKAIRDRRPQARGAAAFADFITAKTVRTTKGRFGYLRIWSFDVDDDGAFLEAAIALLKGLPDRGLIIDLRANPGGFIWAAERMLQLFTPNRITPTKFALRATPLTAAMARAPLNQADLAPWAESLSSAEQTGEAYSSHLSITPEELCNDVGQHYGGPVVVVVDGNTYSSGDLFTAGIVDNGIGPVVAIGEATGAGGANVWGSDDLRVALAAAKSPLPPLPPGVSFTVAVRRAVRSNGAEGTLVEDVGVPGQPYDMTRRDLFSGNRDLIEHCAAILDAQPRTRLRVGRRGRTLSVATEGLDHLDVFADGHPAALPISLNRDGVRRVVIPDGAGEVEVVGFSQGVVRQRRRLTIGRS
ncbi:MAG TPA: S41 family peptidase [Gemmatimonadaceae bacterium]|nr:S41 family peptidase [Gemmatimonadaceae bacterium]